MSIDAQRTLAWVKGLPRASRKEGSISVTCRFHRYPCPLLNQAEMPEKNFNPLCPSPQSNIAASCESPCSRLPSPIARHSWSSSSSSIVMIMTRRPLRFCAWAVRVCVVYIQDSYAFTSFILNPRRFCRIPPATDALDLRT